MMAALASLAKRRQLADTILDRLHAIQPEPRCELYYQSPFQLLVSVVLSAQATDISVNKVMEPLYKSGFDVKTALALGAEGILSKIRSIGLAPTKAKNVFRLSEILAARYDGKIPRTREELEALPGVGRKTANVILGEIFREPTLAVDTHVFRVSHRLGLQRESTPEKAELELLRVVDKRHLPAGHHHFILLGRYICKAAKPDCEACPLNDICPSAFMLQPEKKNPKSAPKARPARAKAKSPRSANP